MAGIDEARGKMDRSTFARQALYEEMKRSGVAVDPSWLDVPDRVRKPVEQYPPHHPRSIQLNSSTDEVKKAALGASSEAVASAAQEYPLSPQAGEPIGKTSRPKRGGRQGKAGRHVSRDPIPTEPKV